MFPDSNVLFLLLSVITVPHLGYIRLITCLSSNNLLKTEKAPIGHLNPIGTFMCDQVYYKL